MEGKTIQQIKDEVARENLRQSWLHLLYDLTELDRFGAIQRLENTAIERYAHQQCELQKSQCAQEARISRNGNDYDDEAFTTNYGTVIAASKQSILTAKNVCDAK